MRFGQVEQAAVNIFGDDLRRHVLNVYQVVPGYGAIEVVLEHSRKCDAVALPSVWTN